MITAKKKIGWTKADETTKRWMGFVRTADIDRLAKMVARHMIQKTTFSPITHVLNFINQTSTANMVESDRMLKDRLDRIVGLGIMYKQNPEQL